jgi:hypothetical protein
VRGMGGSHKEAVLVGALNSSRISNLCFQGCRPCSPYTGDTCSKHRDRDLVGMHRGSTLQGHGEFGNYILQHNIVGWHQAAMNKEKDTTSSS